ncbi:energy-coupling factor transporter transmembrane component T family protein [Chitinasiproducens palmae]|uniref:Biotin transport system permease protein n=1 Tax=Chitinasiproducens palmae TaxID=1770053 RepID=A0A1H2PNN6_9BURK|nr:energy-coupling factor transporter transmembrane protein EcfT [Chitinasiproducens palmae]SDV48308.1 biotin transport system permease protein [Chitinasiproducens palmae]
MDSLYAARRTWLHAVPASLKLAVLAVMGTGLFLTERLVWLAAASALIGLLFASLGRSGRGARRMLVSVAIGCALIVAFHAWTGRPALGAITALRLISASLLGAMLTLTTRFDDLLAVLETVLRPLRHVGVDTARLALALGLMLRFTENFFAQWRRLDDAHRARSGRAGGFALLAPLTIRTLSTARRVADALAVRLGA